jgi:hypothetical protein
MYTHLQFKSTSETELQNNVLPLHIVTLRKNCKQYTRDVNRYEIS